MKRFFSKSENIWNILLLISVVFVSFILPLLSVNWHYGLFRIVYSVIYVSALLSLKRRTYQMLGLFLFTFLAEWISSAIKMPVLHSVSRGLNVVFFLTIVISLIHQIATAKHVTSVVIIGSIAGYLLMGITFSIAVSFIMQRDPGAFNVQLPLNSDSLILNNSIPMYFSYITMATVGYGDVLPLKPYTRSLASLMAVAGQFYIAIIVALLVGKFAAQEHSKHHENQQPKI